LSTENGNQPILEVEAIFIVAVLPAGGSQVILDPTQQFTASRPATPQDVYPACANVVADWSAMKYAEATIALQTQLARQAAEQAQAEAIRRQLEAEQQQRH
jgi:hypothetical protein